MGKVCFVLPIIIILMDRSVTVVAGVTDINITTITMTTQVTNPPNMTTVTQPSVTNKTLRLTMTQLTATNTTETSVTNTTSTAQVSGCPTLSNDDWTIVPMSRLRKMIDKMSESKCEVNTKDLNWTSCYYNKVLSALLRTDELIELMRKGNQLYDKCRTDFCSRKHNPMSNPMEYNFPLKTMKSMLQQGITNCGVDSSFVKWTTKFDECYNVTRAIVSYSDLRKLMQKGQEKCVQEHCKPPYNPNSRMHSDITEAIIITKVYVISVICFMGIIGNILSFMTLSTMEKLNTSIFILKTLAFVDGIHLLLRILLEPYYTAYTFTDWIEKSTDGLNQTVADTYMKVVHYAKPLVEMSQMASAWLVVFLTLDRFIAIRFPFKALSLCTLKMARIGISIVITGSILYIIPVYFGYVYKWERNECTKLFFINITISLLGQNIFYRVVYELALNLVFRNVLPVSLVLGMNVRLVNELRVSRKKRQNITSRTGPDDDKKDRNVTITLISISFVFLFCIIPMVALKIWDIINYSVFKQELPGAGVLLASKYVGSYTGAIIYGMVVDLLLIINSAINILVYCLVRKDFAINMCKMFMCKKRETLVGRSTQFTNSGTHSYKGSNSRGSDSQSSKKELQPKSMTAL